MELKRKRDRRPPVPGRKPSAALLAARRRGLVSRMNSELGYSTDGIKFTLAHWYEFEAERTGLSPYDSDYWDRVWEYVTSKAVQLLFREGPRWLREPGPGR